MIRRIPVGRLIPGMFVVDLHRPWLRHGFWRTQFLVRDQIAIDRLVADGVGEVSIDTRRGLDLPSPSAPQPMTGRSLRQIVGGQPPTVSVGEERRRAARLRMEAQAAVGELMAIARLGGVVEPARLEPVVRRMMESVRRNPDALVPLTRLKQSDQYEGEHAVATAALIIALGLHLGVPEPEVERLALGTLVKDVGQLALDSRLTARHGQLSSTELSQVHRHVEESLAVLDATSRLEETSVAVILEHHERFDGSGYPYRRAGEDISLAGRMAAIVDAYDAMTSDRPYRSALSPVEALRQVFEQSGVQFDPGLVASFVRTVGVYPVGTLVRLESGHLAVVQSQNVGQPLAPNVRVIYDGRHRKYVAPVEVDLARTIGNHYGRIVQAEDYQRWGISPLRWHPS